LSLSKTFNLTGEGENRHIRNPSWSCSLTLKLSRICTAYVLTRTILSDRQKLSFVCTCDRACFLLFLFFSLVRQFGVSECGLSRIFASRRSGSRRSVHGMADIMVGIYSSFSSNCDGRRRPWSRECQLFFRVFCDGRVRGERDEQKKLTKTREERGPRGRRIFTLLGFPWHTPQEKA